MVPWRSFRTAVANSIPFIPGMTKSVSNRCTRAGMCLQNFKCMFAVRGVEHPIPLFPKHCRNQHPYSDIIIDDKDHEISRIKVLYRNSLAMFENSRIAELNSETWFCQYSRCDQYEIGGLFHQPWAKHIN